MLGALRWRISLLTGGAAALALLASVLVATVSATVGPIVVGAALLACSLIVVGIERPALFLGAILLVRPLLDATSEHRLGGGIAAMNVGGAIGLIILVVVLGYALTGVRIKLSSVSRTFVAVIAFSAFETAYAYQRFGSNAGTTAVAELLRLAAILGVFVLATNVFASEQRLRRLFMIVALSAVIPSIVAIYQFATGHAASSEGLAIERAFGTFSGPNPLGEYCALSALVLITAPSGLIRRWLRFAALAVVLAALVITYSRAGYGMLAVGLIAIEYRRLSRRVVWLAAVVVVVLVAVPSVRNRVLPTGTTASPVEQYSRTGQSGLLASGGTYGSLGWRLYNWEKLIGKWEQSPLIGYGLQTTQRVNPVRVATDSEAVGFEAHNTAVRALVEGGPAMLALWALLGGGLIMAAARAKRLGGELQPFAEIVFGVWVAIVFTGLTSDDPFSGGALMYSCFALTGSLLATLAAGRTPRQISTVVRGDERSGV
jgi:O-antigen ligase